MIEASKIIKAFEWMIVDMQHRHNDTKGNLEEGSQGDYSSELKEAMEVLATLKSEGQIIIVGGPLHILNCREFDCFNNMKGQCRIENIHLQSKGSSTIGHLICTEAEEKPEDKE